MIYSKWNRGINSIKCLRWIQCTSSVIVCIWDETSLKVLQKNINFISNNLFLCILRYYSLPRLRTKFGERAFSHAGPATWNALPNHIRTMADPVKFRKLLKSHYFGQAFSICWFLFFSRCFSIWLTFVMHSWSGSAVFKLGSADQRGSATGSHGVRERIPKSSNCLHGF